MFQVQTEVPCGLGFMSKSGAFKRAVQRKRKATTGCPNKPTCWENMNVPPQLKVTNDKKPFLILDKVLDPNTSEKILGFASPAGLQVLRDSPQWSGDGTFEIARFTLFTQIFILTPKTNLGVYVPCAYFMCPNRLQKTYTALFTALKDLLCVPEIFYCDFEAGIHKGVVDVYPDVLIRCCDVHFKRAIRKNIQKHHLLDSYENDAGFQLFIRHIWALSCTY